MRKLAVAMALASTALASPALARDDAWYVGVEGGVMIVEDVALDIGTTENAGQINHDIGYDFGGVVGYDFGGFRAEVEVAYRSADTDTIEIGAPGIPSSPAAVARATGLITTNGDASALSFMVNGLLDFGDDDGLQGFVGGGVGVARTKIINVYNNPAWLNDSDTGFAWQALAGVRTPLTNNIDVGLTYRFFNADGVNLVDRLGRDVNTRLRTHSLLGTLTYNFGEPPAPPPVTPPAPPPVVTPPPPPPPVVVPPPPPPVCNAGPYIVFFDWDKDNITAEAAQTLDNAVSAYANCGNTQVMVAGHADRSGAATYNVGLSNRRATNVGNYLAARGVPASAISTRAFGETQNRVPTPDGVRNDQNRRVEINYGPGAGR